MVRSTAPLKSVCTEQVSKLQVRHHHDLELLDDIRTFSKQRAAIEATYAQALLKLVQAHIPKKEQNSTADSQSSVDVKEDKSKTPGRVWRDYIDETERIAKCHQLLSDVFLHQVYEPAQILRKSKAQVLKKVIDQLQSVQKEVLQSSNELTECHKVYSKEGLTAADARQKAESLEDKVKKKSTGLFQSMASLQKKSEKASTLQEQCEVKATAARNSYLIQLTLTNTQLSRYFDQDVPSLIRQLDSNVTGQIQQFMATICKAEMDTTAVAIKGFSCVQSEVDTLSGQQTMETFFHDHPVFTDVVQHSFEPVEGDTVDHVSTAHQGDDIIIAEQSKWSNFLVQESKNINSLKQELSNIRRTLVNATRLASPSENPSETSKSTLSIVEDCEARLDDLRMAIRRSRTNKVKAEAVLALFRNVGIDLGSDPSAMTEPEEEDDEETICAEIRHLQHQLRVGATQPNALLSPSMSLAGKTSALSVALSSGSVTPTSLASPNPSKSQQQVCSALRKPIPSKPLVLKLVNYGMNYSSAPFCITTLYFCRNDHRILI